MNITQVLNTIRPGASWQMWENDYARLEWKDKVQAKPTLAEIEAAWPAVDASTTAEVTCKAAIDAAITADAVLTQFKTMTNAEYSTWFDANITTAAQAITLLKRVTKLVRRKLL